MFSRFFIIALLLTTPIIRGAAQEKPAPKAAPTPEVLNAQGVSIEFKVVPVHGHTPRPVAGEEATIGFKITGTTGAVPLTNLRPTAWIDQRQTREASEPQQCREKVQSFLQASFSKRPTLDLNSYFILTLNQEPNISVIDPLSGFGGSKLYNLIALASPGEDWVMRSDHTRLYVSMPAVNQVAVVDLSEWKSIAAIDAGTKPGRIVLQNDGRYLWVGSEADSGVTVIDTATLKVVAQIKTGAGHHEFAFTDDDRFAFVTNQQDGTLSVIDTRQLARVKDLKTGAAPVAVAFSPLSKALYVASEQDGTITVVDTARLEILTHMKARPGLRNLSVQPDGRFGFAVNPAENAVFVFDLTSNKLIHSISVGPGADQITFTKQFAYIRSSGSEFVNMIKLADLGKEAAITRFPAGQKAPKESAASSLANAITPAAEEGAVVVANPADRMIYYYMEGMAAPMGTFQNYRRVPRALLVLDKGLRETARGVYSTTIRLDTPGYYDAVFLLDSPRAVHCFDFSVDQNPAQSTSKSPSLKAERVINESPIAFAGESYKFRFKIVDATTGGSLTNLNDIGVLVFLAPGIWQDRVPAKPVAGGAYEIDFVPPQTGVYYVYFSIPSLDVSLNQIMPLVLETQKK